MEDGRNKKQQHLIRTLQGTFLPSMVPIHPVVLEKKFVLHISHWVAMLTYVPRWWPSWIFNRSKKYQLLVSSLQWSFLTIFNSIPHVVSEKKIFEISANQRLLWPLSAILDNRSKQKVTTIDQNLVRNISAKNGSNPSSGSWEEVCFTYFP